MDRQITPFFSLARALDMTSLYAASWYRPLFNTFAHLNRLFCVVVELSAKL